jgi:hypothetical protein
MSFNFSPKVFPDFQTSPNPGTSRISLIRLNRDLTIEFSDRGRSASCGIKTSYARLRQRKCQYWEVEEA